MLVSMVRMLVVANMGCRCLEPILAPSPSTLYIRLGFQTVEYRCLVDEEYDEFMNAALRGSKSSWAWWEWGVEMLAVASESIPALIHWYGKVK